MSSFVSSPSPCAVPWFAARVRMSMIKRYLPLLCLAGLLLLSGCSSRVELFSALKDVEANEILGVLLQSKIEVTKLPEKNGVTLTVAGSDVPKALEILRLRGLPRTHYEGMGKIFHKDGMISSPLEEQARYVYALSQELENTLTQLDGVLVARVHVVLPVPDISNATKSAASASVFIKYQDDYNLELLKPQIQSLVASAIPELEENRVSVVLVAAHRLTQSSTSSVSQNSDPAAQQSQTRFSSSSMRWVLAGVAIVFLLGTLLIWARRRMRAAENAEPSL
jgi:type III secretion protein J